MYSEFENILQRLKQGRLWDFPGGVHPDQRKAISSQEPIVSLPLANKLFVTVKQHIGVEGHLVVNEGDRVLKGQKLTTSMNPFAVPVHAPTSGKVSRIGKHVSAHPSGLPELTIEIEPDKFDTWCELTPLKDYQDRPKIKVVEAICDAGITGMGGAGFPTHIKASPKKNVEFLIINGVECEPYITADDRLMREHAWQVRQGIDVLVHLLSPKQVIIAIEDNKPEAIEAMQIACQEADYLVCAIPTKYPAGGEKQLIQVLTNREVPQKGLPIDVGVIMQNVGTCFAIADAIFSGKPLIQRVVTLTGEGLDRHGNAWVPIGTPMSHLLAQAEYHQKRQQQTRIIMGGPMMGFSVSSPEVPVIKSTNCILVPADEEIPLLDQEQPCIRCGACADACPASLLPQQMYWHSKAKELDKAQDYNLFDCIECGACAFVCPSEIPLVHYYRIAKAEIRAQEEEKDKADKARERFEARKERLEREAKEREEKHRKAAEARKQAMNKDDAGAKDKIAAALARAKAKKQGATETQGETTEQENQPVPSSSQSDKVAAAIARAKAKKQAAQQQSDNETANADVDTEQQDDKKAKVAAAIARAKAKKQAANAPLTEDSQQQTDVTPDKDDKKDKIAAAIARAKAKKLAAEQSQANDEKPQQDPQTASQTDPEPEQSDRQKRIAAAVAKAKAKKQAAMADADNNTQPPETENQAEIAKPDAADGDKAQKQGKIAAAIAKAKAKKEQRQKQLEQQEQDEK